MPWQEASSEEGLLAKQQQNICFSVQFNINFTKTDNTDTKEHKNTIKLFIV